MEKFPKWIRRIIYCVCAIVIWVVFFYICEYLGIEPKDFFDTASANPTKAYELYEIAKTLDNERLDNLISLARNLKK